jgi:uncharacterized membrane protein YoaK (UPF0700 family)
MKSVLVQKVIGLLWTVGAGVLLATEILDQLQSEFWLGYTYYILVWGYCIFCIVSGLLLTFGWHKSRVLLSSSAILLVTYSLFLLAAYGAESKTSFFIIYGSLVVFAVGTLLVLWIMPPNPALNPDAPKSGAPVS